MKTIFTEKSVVFENVPIEKGGLVIYAGTAKKFTKKKPWWTRWVVVLLPTLGVIGVPVAVAVLVS